MIRALWRRCHWVTSAVAAALAIISLSSCGVPLAPGYKIQKETLSVRFVPGNPPHLAIRADYTLVNIGNASLRFVPVALPPEKDFGLANFGAKIGGKDVAPQHNPHEVPEDWRIPVAPSWQQKQKINLTLSYHLATETPADPRIFVASNTFYLNDSGWFPALMGFKNILSPSVTRPNPADLIVTVPGDFRVTASGRLRSTKKQSDETEYRFRIGKTDFDPYILAGQYSEHRVSSANAIFWSGQSLPNLQQSATDLSRARQLYVHRFGPLPRNNATVYVVAHSGASPSSDGANVGDVLPAVMFVAESINSSQRTAVFPSSADEKNLAATWFFHIVKPRPEAWLLAEGLSSYAAELDDQQQASNTSRRAEISLALANFDGAAKEAVEKAVLSLSLQDSIAQRRISQSKIMLFFFALEDQCGQQNVTHAIHDMVYALRGEEYGYSDFRAALEQQCHQELGEVFRTWLTKPGVPPDFRARYENAGASQQ